MSQQASRIAERIRTEQANDHEGTADLKAVADTLYEELRDLLNAGELDADPLRALTERTLKAIDHAASEADQEMLPGLLQSAGWDAWLVTGPNERTQVQKARLAHVLEAREYRQTNRRRVDSADDAATQREDRIMPWLDQGATVLEAEQAAAD